MWGHDRKLSITQKVDKFCSVKKCKDASLSPRKVRIYTHGLRNTPKPKTGINTMKSLEIVKIENELAEMNRVRKTIKNKNSVSTADFPKLKRTWKHKGIAL